METLKKCTACEQDLPQDEFSIRSDTGKRYSQCRACKNAKSTAFYRANTKRHADWVKRRYDTFGRFRRYGITREQYDAALVAQGGCCALCGTQKPGGKGKWHIDHRHVESPRKGFNQTEDASLFRGVLCHKCNISLGHYEKLIARVGSEKLFAYLASPDGGGIDDDGQTSQPS